MKTEPSVYGLYRQRLAVHPVYFARFRHVPVYGDGVDYAFSRDFSTDTVLTPTTTKLIYLEDNIQFRASSVVPEQGRATIGGGQLSLVDVNGEVLRYLSRPQLRLASAMTTGSPTDGGAIQLLSTPVGLPSLGTVEITTAGVIERVRYSAKSDSLMTLTVATAGRGVDGTTAAAHAIGDSLTNGEEIRPGQRVQLYAGYAELQESEYMLFATLEVIRRQTDPTGTTFLIEMADIQRSLRRQVFLGATEDTPLTIVGNPLTLYLQVLLSTGLGTNGPYDVRSAEDGLATPQLLVDVAGIELVRDVEFPTDTYTFRIKTPFDGKTWLEEQILKTLNCYPLVTQAGKLTVKRFKNQVGSPTGSAAILHGLLTSRLRQGRRDGLGSHEGSRSAAGGRFLIPRQRLMVGGR